MQGHGEAMYPVAMGVAWYGMLAFFEHSSGAPSPLFTLLVGKKPRIGTES